MGRRGQNTTSLAVLWGVSLLITAASFAGIYSLDPFEANSDTQRCSTSDRTISCDDSKATALANQENSSVQVPLANQENTALNVQNPRITSINGEELSEPCAADQAVVGARSETMIRCDNVNATITAGTPTSITLEVVTSSTDTPSFTTNRTISTTLTPRDPQKNTLPTAPSNLTDVLAQMAGSGTPGDPYIITNVEELQAMDAERDAHYKLGNDIDASPAQYWNNGSGFKPVATYSNRFEGSLDGDGKTITSLYIDNPGSWASLVTSTSPNARLHDLTVQNADITGNYYAGILVGLNTGPIRDVSVSGDITAWGAYTGGAVGLADGYPGGALDASYNGYDENSSIKDVSANVDIIHNDSIAGGVVGYAAGGPYADLAAQGTIYSNYTGYGGVGGTVGYGENGAQIRRNQANVKINATGNNEVGGLVGFLDVGSIRRSYATGNVIGDTNVGGLVGTNDNLAGDIWDAYAHGDVTGNTDVGGLVGENENEAAVDRSYAAGNVTGTTNVGGVIGSDEGGSVHDTYWDETSTGVTASATTNSTALNTSEMQGSAAPSNMTGLDFTSDWKTAAGYPELAWE